MRRFLSTQRGVAAAAAVALAVLASPASAGFINVCGSPGHTPGVGGFQSAFQRVVPGAGVNDSGTAVGYADKVDGSGVSKGDRAFRWDGSGAAVELGNLGTDAGGFTKSEAFAINRDGTAVGQVRRYESGVNMGWRAVRWGGSGTAVELANIGTDGGYTDSAAYGVNAGGTAVGYAYRWASDVSKGYRAVRWDGSGTAVTELANLGTNTSGVAFGRAWAVNTAGTTVGYVQKFDVAGVHKGERAVRWGGSSDAVTELGNLGTTGGYTSTDARAINAAGTTVGVAQKYVSNLDKGLRAVRWDASGTAASELANLGTDAGGFTENHAFAINADGTTVGCARKFDLAGAAKGWRAVRWDGSGTAASELGSLGTDANGVTLSAAQAVNTDGAAVGFSYKYDVAGTFLGQKAVYWGLDGVALDLNTLIDPASGWTLTDARAFSDGDWVSGMATFDPDGPGGQAAYGRLFLIQVPEPTSLALLGVGGLALLRRRRASCRTSFDGPALIVPPPVE